MCPWQVTTSRGCRRAPPCSHLVYLCLHVTSDCEQAGLHTSKPGRLNECPWMTSVLSNPRDFAISSTDVSFLATISSQSNNLAKMCNSSLSFRVKPHTCTICSFDTKHVLIHTVSWLIILENVPTQMPHPSLRVRYYSSNSSFETQKPLTRHMLQTKKDAQRNSVLQQRRYPKDVSPDLGIDMQRQIRQL